MWATRPPSHATRAPLPALFAYFPARSGRCASPPTAAGGGRGPPTAACRRSRAAPSLGEAPSLGGAVAYGAWRGGACALTGRSWRGRGSSGVRARVWVGGRRHSAGRRVADGVRFGGSGQKRQAVFVVNDGPCRSTRVVWWHNLLPLCSTTAGPFWTFLPAITPSSVPFLGHQPSVSPPLPSPLPSFGPRE